MHKQRVEREREREGGGREGKRGERGEGGERRENMYM